MYRSSAMGKFCTENLYMMMMWWLLIGIVDVYTENSFQLKLTTCHYVQNFVHNYIHQAFSFCIVCFYEFSAFLLLSNHKFGWHCIHTNSTNKNPPNYQILCLLCDANSIFNGKRQEGCRWHVAWYGPELFR